MRRAREGDPEPAAHARWFRAVTAHSPFIHEGAEGRSFAEGANKKRVLTLAGGVSAIYGYSSR